MPKKKSDRLDEVDQAIKLLEKVEDEWETGYKNPLLKEALGSKRISLLEEYYHLNSQKKGGKRPEEDKKSGRKKEIQPP